MIYSLSQYLLSVEHLDKMARTLDAHSISLLRDDEGRVKCRVGNSVIIFEVMYKGVHSALRIYMRQHHNLRAIYGEKYLPKELLVCSTATLSGLVDVVISEWFDGSTLQSIIEKYYANSAKMSALSQMFEEFAIGLLSEPWAHGDIKPENIILGGDGLHLIDFDAMFRPGFSSDDYVEIGTRQYQHPQRNKLNFNKSIDDYPIALITTALAAMSLDKRLGKELLHSDNLLITPHLAIEGRDKQLDYIENLFAEVGDVRHYRIARLLRSPHPSLPQLKSLLEMSIRHIEGDEEPLLEYYNGGWGYTLRGEFIIPPYYDIAFDFREGLGLVCIADVWHFIDHKGRVVIHCGRGSNIKPFRNGVTHIKRDNGTIVKIYRDGRMESVL